MKITKIKIQNFRKLQDIEFTCKQSINTIVGPNGVGKSTIIEAIRLVKAILLPSQDNEGTQTMQNMGVLVPQNNALLMNSISNDLSKPTIIKLTLQIADDELKLVADKIDEFAVLRLQNALGQGTQNRLNLVGFLSTPVGTQQLESIKKESMEFLQKFTLEKKDANIELVTTTQQIFGRNGLDQEMVSFIFRNSPISQTLFSVFPADRSFPTGDVNIQIGQADLSTQIISHSVQPHLKFASVMSI